MLPSIPPATYEEWDGEIASSLKSISQEKKVVAGTSEEIRPPELRLPASVVSKYGADGRRWQGSENENAYRAALAAEHYSFSNSDLIDLVSHAIALGFQDKWPEPAMEELAHED